MEIRDYLFISSDNDVVLSDYKTQSDLRITGNVYGKKSLLDGTTVVTSSVSEFIGDPPSEAITATGSRYSLSTINRDFAEALNVIDKGEIPVITKWHIDIINMLAKHFSDEDFEKDEFGLIDPDKITKKMAETETYKAIILNGKLPDGTSIAGEVIAQNGNFVTLSIRTINSAGQFETIEKDFLVIWRNMDKKVVHEIMFTDEYIGLDYGSFETAFHYKCRPNLAGYLEEREKILANNS